MIPAALTPTEQSRHIRRMDVTRDLNQVADLIELCFPIQQDPDGQTYVQQMRKAAREMRYLGWFSTLADLGNTQASGFVWEDQSRIIGNLSLIPFQQNGHKVHLIANVAVHPDFRRAGIARALTTRTLNYLRRRGEQDTWLQVRDDNPAAQALYHLVGFTDQVVRTTWRIRPLDFQLPSHASNDPVQLRKRKQSDWEQQRAWLKTAYPDEMRWNLPLDFRWFKPEPFQGLTQFMDGIRLRQWAFESAGSPAGWITWQKTNSFAHNLWLAFSPEEEARHLPEALHQVIRRLPRQHPLSIDYPHGRFQEGFAELGFNAFRTLIWMRCKLK